MKSLLRLVTGSVLGLALLLGSASVVGCNTAEGVGRDIERVGDKIEDAAD